jgi:dUTP pyrophosphatase
MTQKIKVQLLRSEAKLPVKAHMGDLGYDLFSSEEVFLSKNEMRLISTGIAIEFPEGYGGIIKDRSSMVTKKHITTHAGVIDSGYTGEIKIAIRNNLGRSQVLGMGEKIAQLILVPVVSFEVQEVDTVVSSDGRADGGFGSTGK